MFVKDCAGGHSFAWLLQEVTRLPVLEAVDGSDRTVLHDAADQGHSTVVEVSLAAGVEKEKPDQLERSPYMWLQMMALKGW